MDKVRRLIEAGASVPTAIKETLGMKLEDFATAVGVHPKAVSNYINGAVRPTSKFISALVEHFGGSELEWRTLLWEAGRPAGAEESEGAALQDEPEETARATA